MTETRWPRRKSYIQSNAKIEANLELILELKMGFVQLIKKLSCSNIF